MLDESLLEIGERLGENLGVRVEAGWWGAVGALVGGGWSGLWGMEG